MSRDDKATELVPTQISAMAKLLGYDGDLTLGAVEDRARIYQRRTAEDAIELGKCLLLIKEMTPHGEFQKRIDMLGIPERTGRRFMQAAAKIAQNGHLADLSRRVKSLGAVLELVTTDDEVLEDLSAMDDIDTMTASQLRERLRQLEDGRDEAISTLKANLELERGKAARYEQAASKTRLTRFHPRTEAVRDECMAEQKAIEAHLSGLRTLFDEVMAEGVDAPEQKMRLDQVWVTAHIVAAHALDLIARMEDQVQPGAMPDRILSQHCLTPAEAERWLHDAPLIEARADAERAAREQARADGQPRKAGRPKNSKNKPKEGAA